MKGPLLSILSITYNHEKYIAQAIESWLMQKTNFDIEIVIGEDCSTDNTRAIIEQYRLKSPDLIRVITSETNVGMMPNVIRTLEACKGKYIALCEGDDYWTDPLKLKKQVDFLEKNKEYAISSHETLVWFEGESKKILFSQKEGNAFKGKFKNRYSIEDTFEGWFIHTSSLVYRNNHLPIEFQSVPNGDMFLISYLSQFGDIFVMNDLMSVYRINDGGITKTDGHVGLNYLNNYIITYNEVKKVLPQFRKRIDTSISKYYFWLSFEALSLPENDNNKEAWKYFKKAYSNNIKIVFTYPFRSLLIVLVFLFNIKYLVLKKKLGKL